jgi:hypothetical protein
LQRAATARTAAGKVRRHSLYRLNVSMIKRTKCGITSGEKKGGEDDARPSVLRWMLCSEQALDTTGLLARILNSSNDLIHLFTLEPRDPWHIRNSQRTLRIASFVRPFSPVTSAPRETVASRNFRRTPSSTSRIHVFCTRIRGERAHRLGPRPAYSILRRLYIAQAADIYRPSMPEILYEPERRAEHLERQKVLALTHLMITDRTRSIAMQQLACLGFLPDRLVRRQSTRILRHSLTFLFAPNHCTIGYHQRVTHQQTH